MLWKPKKILWLMNLKNEDHGELNMDINEEIAKEDHIEQYILMCGTCKYRRKSRCHNFSSENYEELVDELCSCDYFVPRKGLHII